MKKLTKNKLNNLKKQSKPKEDKKQIDKVIEVNKLFKQQALDLIQKYDLTETEQNNLSNMADHFDNMNELFSKFKK